MIKGLSVWSWQPRWPLVLPQHALPSGRPLSACGWVVSFCSAPWKQHLSVLGSFSWSSPFHPTDSGVFPFWWELLWVPVFREGTLALWSPSQVWWGLKVAFSSKYAELVHCELKVVLLLYGKTFLHSSICLQNCIDQLGYWWSLVSISSVLFFYSHWTAVFRALPRILGMLWLI